MAASPGAEEDSVYDTGRLSLFDIILEKTRAQNKVKKTSSHILHFKFFLSKNYHELSLQSSFDIPGYTGVYKLKLLIWRLSDALWAYIFIWLQKQLVHRLVYVSKIRQDVNERKEIGGRLLLTL